MAVEGQRELEDFLTGVFEGREPEQPAETEEPRETEALTETPEPEIAPEVIYDEPEQEAVSADTPRAEQPPAEEEETPPEEEEGDPALAWAKKKYGDDPQKWAAAAYQQEQHISRLADEKRQAEEFAQQMADYAQYAERQAIDSQQSGMPLSQQEEAWIEQSLGNPLQAAYAAYTQGNMQLYNGLISRVAEMDPGMAANVGAQVQIAAQQNQAQQRVQADAQAARSSDFPTRLGESVGRVGIDLEKYCPQMSEKIGELGEYHPYVQTLMHDPDAGRRDLALMAVFDLVRSGQTSVTRARESEREAAIRKEAEMRREAASVVTGSPHAQTPKHSSPLIAAMEEEWRRAGQWQEE
jgi:hypothetical protein